MQRLDRRFFERPVQEVAQGLLGCSLFFRGERAIITETEAYGGSEDPASHAFVRQTPRNTPMFGPAGHSYVYLIYGLHHCLNVVTGIAGQASAVLMRGGMIEQKNINGPGRFCHQLGITRQENNVDCTQSHDFYFCAGPSVSYQATSRIGIRQGKDFLWRFVMTSFFMKKQKN